MGANFTGWATKVGLKCSDGRTIMPDAFKDMDGERVPLVWMHGHKDVENVLGYVMLKHHEEGVRAEAFFNETPRGQHAKAMVEHGDVDSLSIYANSLLERSKQVFHGKIREVSLVLSGANPGAKIDAVVIAHDTGGFTELEDEAIITTGLSFEHVEITETEDEQDEYDSELAHATVREIYEGMTPDQQEVVQYMVGAAMEASGALQQSDNDNEDTLTHQEGDNVTRNVFDKTAEGGNMTHSNGGEKEEFFSHDGMIAVWQDVKKGSTFKESIIRHADEYGVTNIEALFPNARNLNTQPEFITRRMEWVETVMGGVSARPYARIKTMSADLTHDEARAKGYIKGTMKKEQFFEVKSRETTPKTIYKKQRLDRDDIIDVTDFDIVAWFWVEMYFMLREEIARAILVGDGRPVDHEDKINENNIRPIATDDEFYTDRLVIPNTATKAEDMVDAILLGRENYKGAGQPTLFITQANATKMLLARDNDNRRMWRTAAELASELQVSRIVYVPVMAGAKLEGDDIWGILVDLQDYAIGTDKGGEITKFTDFDIDYNQYKYLIEGRLSGALIHPKRAQVLLLEGAVSETVVTPQEPSFVSSTGVVTVPTQTGVVYKNSATGATLSGGAQTALANGATLKVRAEPASSSYAVDNDAQKAWSYTRPAA